MGQPMALNLVRAGTPLVAWRVSSPLLDVCHALYGEADALGHGGSDMVAVLRAIEARTAAS
jgi:3-hydroxyisobutyrate dehydrogenase